MRHALLAIGLVFVTACSDGPAPPAAAPTAGTTRAPLPAPSAPPPAAPDPVPPATPPPQTPATDAPMPAASAATTLPERAPGTDVVGAGTYAGAMLIVHLAFVSEVDDVTTAEFREAAMVILTDDAGWGRSGFAFVADEASGLRVVLAEGRRVDALCLPLETSGRVSCQNGPVVALNADRWRTGAREWDSTVAAYRVYLVNHEVGHLIGLRHPQNRCPRGEPVAAVMEPQTDNPASCAGNGVPLDWEITWATNRPAVVAPDPDWDGPRPQWPEDGG